MQELKNYFITIDREYKEGDVAVFRQKFSGKGVVSAVLFSTALGVYEAQINGKKWGSRCLPLAIPIIRAVSYIRKQM